MLNAKLIFYNLKKVISQCFKLDLSISTTTGLGKPLKQQQDQHETLQLFPETVWRKILPHHTGTIPLVKHLK